MDLTRSSKLTRRDFLRKTIQYGTGAALALGAYGGLYERRRLQVKHVDISLTRLSEPLSGFTIAHLSDLHYHPLFSADVIRDAIRHIMEASPDLVVLTGDFVTCPYFDEAGFVPAKESEPCAQLLAPLVSKFRVAAVLGNHDHCKDPDSVAASFSMRGIPVLRNQSLPVERDSSRIWIAGLEDVLESKPNLERALSAIPRSEPVVLLVHEPDYADVVVRRARNFPVDLQLSGHSHGGQVRIPGIGPVVLPYGARKYPYGLRQVGPMMLYTNPGLGTIRLPIRIDCPPELTLLTLHPGLQRSELRGGASAARQSSPARLPGSAG